MARPPLPLGQHGAISVTSNNGRWIARCRVRGLDGVTRKIERSGKSRTAARLALQDELRSQRGERAEVLRPESRFRDAVTIYLGKVTARREDSTTDVYSYWLEKLVLPSSASCAWASATWHRWMPSSPAWSAAGASSNTRTARPRRSLCMRPTPAASTAPSWPASCSRPCSTRPSPPTPSASWSASSPRRGTARPHRAA